MKSRAQATIIFLSLAILSLSPKKTFSADVFDLSYTLTEGGYRLELNQANPSKGLKIDATSNIATRYEVIQKIIKPLENRDNPGLSIQDNLLVRGLIGTNKFGSFRIAPNDTPIRSEDVLYVSDTIGSSDSFTLVYSLRQTEDIAPGYYFGRIGFVLNPIDSTKAQVTKIVDIYVNVSEKEIEPKIEISTASGSGNIILNPKHEESQTADVLVKIKGGFAKQFSIAQVLSGPIESQEGNRLDYQLVNFVVKEVKRGNAQTRTTALSLGLENIYTSGASGEYDEYFTVSYGIGDLSTEKVGTYRARIQYLLTEEGAGLQTKIETLDLEIENERIFDLAITPADQRYAIQFSNLKPTEPSRKNEVTIEASTNIGKQYQVSQEVYAELTNKEGETIPARYFTFFTQGEDMKGKLRFTDKQEVKKGSAVLFVSDNDGSADKFKVVYELECPKDLKAGNYATRITYSLSEI